MSITLTGYNVNHPILTAEREAKLLKRVKRLDCQASLKELVDCNVRSVIKRVNKLGLARSEEVEDYMQAGFMGLLKAISKFNPELEYRLSTYATWWIDQTILRCKMNEAEVVRIPVHVHQAARDIGKIINVELDGEACLEKVNGVLKSKGEKLLDNSDWQLISSVNTGKYLTTNVTELGRSSNDEDDEVDFFELIPSHQMTLPADLPEGTGLLDQVQTLNDKERKVLTYRFGLGVDEHTLEEVGSIMGVTRERIRQIQVAALNKCRSAFSGREEEFASLLAS